MNERGWGRKYLPVLYNGKIGGGRKREVNGRRKWKTSSFIGVKGSTEWRGQIETHGGFMESNGKGVCIKLVIDNRNYPELLLVCELEAMARSVPSTGFH